MQKLYFLLFSLLLALPLSAQDSDDCNHLGAWLWFIEITGFDTHAEIADSLSNMGVKRIYVKVADGGINPAVWPELLDASVVADYKSRGLEVWAWSYNYPGNDSLQAEALYLAAETGYEGFVVDVEIEFDGDSTNLSNLFTAFNQARDRAVSDDLAEADFPLYCTTWGNPIDHDFRIDVIDPFVDAFMPQTYVEIWGQSFIDNQVFWIEVGNDEYADLGATKPIHHICATEQDNMSSAELNEFIATSGPETSLWRIPGGGTPLSIWEDWAGVEWDMDFCEPVSTQELEQHAIKAFPNPVEDILKVELPIGQMDVPWQIYSMQGQLLQEGLFQDQLNTIDLTNLPVGAYFLEMNNASRIKIVKL